MKNVETFLCDKCRQRKPATEFYEHQFIKRYWMCKECDRTAVKAWHARNKGMHSVYSKRAKLKSKYGLTPEVYTAMLQAQFYKCAVCGDKFEPDGKMKDPCVDHNHDTGAVRELICRQCNLTIGRAEDNITRLEKAIAYLRRHGK
jgi:hypothetical protein